MAKPFRISPRSNAENVRWHATLPRNTSRPLTSELTNTSRGRRGTRSKIAGHRDRQRIGFTVVRDRVTDRVARLSVVNRRDEPASRRPSCARSNTPSATTSKPLWLGHFGKPGWLPARDLHLRLKAAIEVRRVQSAARRFRLCMRQIDFDRLANLGIALDFERSRRVRSPQPQKSPPAKSKPSRGERGPLFKSERAHKPARAPSALEQQEVRDAARGATSPLDGRAVTSRQQA